MKAYLKIIIYCAIALSLALCGVLVISGLSKTQNSTGKTQEETENKQQEDLILNLIVDQNVQVEISETKTFLPTVVCNKHNEEYSVDISILNQQIASIQNSLITPHMVGTTTIKTTLTHGNTTILKETTLSVVNSNINYNFNIYQNNSLVEDFLIKGKTYNIVLQKDYSYYCQNTISVQFENTFNHQSTQNAYSITKIEKTYSKAEFLFVPNLTGKYTIKIEDEHKIETIKADCKTETNSILADVSNAKFAQDLYNLYLFNNQYNSQANENGFYQNSQITFSQNADSYESLLFEFQNVNENPTVQNLITYSQTNSTISILANQQGLFDVKIFSNKSNYSKVLHFKISNLYANTISFNGTNYNIGQAQTINLSYQIDQSQNFIVEKTPIYSLENCIIENSDESVTIAQNKITISDFTVHTILVKYNNITILTIKYNPQRDFFFVINSQTNIQSQKTCQVETNTNEQLKVNLQSSNEEYYFKITYTISNDNMQNYSKAINCEILDENFNAYTNFPLTYEADGNSILFTIKNSQKISFYIRLKNDVNVFKLVTLNIE